MTFKTVNLIGTPGQVPVNATTSMIQVFSIQVLIRETRSTSHDADGCRAEIAVTESSDHPAVTNSIVCHDFLGRVIATLTPAIYQSYKEFDRKQRTHYFWEMGH